MSVQIHPKAASSSQMGWRRADQRAGWLFISPAFLILFIFLVIPFLMAVFFSFTDQRLIPNPNLPTSFVGLRNFERMLGDETLHHALINNFLFALIVVPTQTAFALFLATLINQRLRGVNVFRTIYFSPVVTAMAVIAIVWSFLYNPGEGLINAFIGAVSLGQWGPYSWLSDTRLALPAIMLMSIWQGVGFQMVIYLAGLQDIPEQLYEAAQIDGANRWQQFVGVTLPQLRNTTIFIMIATTILSFRLFDQVEVMTQGGPEDATMTTVLHIVNEGFRTLRIGYASAISVVFFLIVLAISILQRVVLTEEG
ncbi:MAG: sugar ABC transporter permease [Chloroflexi bacterium AL-W]|nr:sugar ABC transporter permease [Chloroflexi bacterium AL-N1]NOK70450.1 sugar ABC transporter permease [Chloroflexi bacterium AL-N10]NOK78191.1 sugar ABC transporter permease [Chloroflexi bacterium AL-N5]NOK85290.1 sugar ABC transporter permease [Chloroflexi bacterium AL-W]NOK92055.1 sugar ABC transporter permease [Chloroflexi bacterium AL-N15]